MIKFLTLGFIFLLSSCQTESQSPLHFPHQVNLISPSGKVIKTKVSFKWDEQQQGLSGIKPEDFGNDEGMLFFNLEDDERNFWMPDTYFDLDLIYLDNTLKIIDIVRKLPHYIGRSSPELIPRARTVWARHTLEMKSGGQISTELKIGDSLKWDGLISLKETEDLARKMSR